MEGDGALALECYEILSTVKAAVQVCHLPNTAAVSKRIANINTSEQYWISYAKTCIQPGVDYFHSKFGIAGDLLPAVNAFKAARLFLPSKINDLKPEASTVDTLRSFKFLNNDLVMNELKAELSKYLAVAEGVSTDTPALQ